jgi:hypothetical protein
MGCVYGDWSMGCPERLVADGRLDVVDVLTMQL